MKKYIGSIVVVLVLAGYLVYQHVGGTSNPSETATPSGSPVPTKSPSATTGMYRDGSYTGSAADATYGIMQVQAIISGGKLTDVQFLQYPNSPGHTSEVSAMSLPILKSEAIQAQNSHVAIISGATQTSEAFQQSLAVALAMAK